MKMSLELDNIMLSGEYIGNIPDDGRHWDAIGGLDSYKVIFRLADIFVSGEIKIKITKHGRVFYGVSKIKNITDGTRDLLGEIPTIPSISDKISKPNCSSEVKDQFSALSSITAEDNLQQHNSF